MDTSALYCTSNTQYRIVIRCWARPGSNS